jgi:hypothetical protein
VTAYDFLDKDRVIRYYRALEFENHIRNALRAYVSSFPDRLNAITVLSNEIGLGKL